MHAVTSTIAQYRHRAAVLDTYARQYRRDGVGALAREAEQDAQVLRNAADELERAQG